MYDFPGRPSRPLSGVGRAAVTAALALAVGSVMAMDTTPAVAQAASGPAGGGGSPVSQWEPEAARDSEFPLTIESIMRAEEIVGQSPTSVSWTDDSEWVYFRWLPAGHDWNAERELWRVPADGGEPELIDDPVEVDSLAITFGGGDISPDRQWRVMSHRGDLYLVDRSDLSFVRLTETVRGAGSPRFSRDGGTIFFSVQNQVKALDLDAGTVRQITDIREGEAEEDPEPEGHREFLVEQQEELFEHIQRREAERERREERRDALQREELQTVHTGEHGSPSSLSVNRTGTHVAVTTRIQAPGQPERVGVPRWITDDGYTSFDDTRTKVGDATGASRFGVHPVGSDSIVWLDVQEEAEAHAQDHEPVGPFVPEQHEAVRDGDVEVQNVRFRGWNDAGTYGLVSAHSRDDKHRWILSFEAETGEMTMLEHLADSAWVAGPCRGCVGWIPESDRAYYVSEATRWAHLYTVNADGSDPEQLTSGEWEVHSVRIPEQRDRFHLRTNEETPYEQHFYHMAFDGGERTRITDGTGRFNVTPSPEGDRLAVVHSTGDRPGEVFLADHEPGAEMERVTHSPSEEWLAYDWLHPEIVEFEARDGVEVPARIYRPEDVGAEPHGGAVLFVHGAGYLQNVHHWWSSYYREYMFHHFLAAQGFTVLDVDFRASAGYGRDWRTAVYRHMGGADLQDYVDAVDYLVEEEGVDRDRIGLYGGSYGGFITLMALFTEPDVFHAGAALRSVTDWAHYNQGYTSNILNEPQEDPEAYRQSSPIYFAEGLEGHLLMGHPMYDTNVHFSDIVRLTQRLVELGKENWELSVYPTENHGMVEPASWVDQYRRIYELFWTTLSAPGCTEGTGNCELPVFQEAN